jgi:hypothetical protein
MCMEVMRDITTKYCAPDGSGILKEFSVVPLRDHPVHLRNIHCAFSYHLMAATLVDRRMEAAKKNAKLGDLTSLRVMGDAFVKIWGGKTSDEFVWKEV